MRRLTWTGLGILLLTVTAACASAPGPDPTTGPTPIPTYAAPNASAPGRVVVRLSLAGGDQAARTGSIDSGGVFHNESGSSRTLDADTWSDVQSWLANPSALGIGASAAGCSFGADQRFLAIELSVPTEVAQPIRVCLNRTRGVPGRASIPTLASLLDG